MLKGDWNQGVERERAVGGVAPPQAAGGDEGIRHGTTHDDARVGSAEGYGGRWSRRVAGRGGGHTALLA